MVQPNADFRVARERVPSRQTPGAGLSRQEVAYWVNEWIFRRAGKVVELDANYIGKLERGVIRWPSRLYREALRAVLRVETDAQLGFYAQRRRTGTVTDVDRQQFLRLAGTVMTLPWLDLFTPPTPTPTPTRVDEAEIEQLRSMTSAFLNLDNSHGGGHAREAVFAQLRWSAQLLHAECPERLRPRLFAAVAHLGSVAGFMAFDAYAHDDARRAYQFSLQCAEQAGDWHLRALILNYMARQANLRGQLNDALTYVETALVRRERLTCVERAAVHAERARVLARLGRVQETLEAIGTADEEFARANREEGSPWLDFYDHAQHHQDTGRALFDLAMTGRKTASAQRLAYAVARYGPSSARARAMAQTKLASLLMTTGDPRHGAAVGHHALEAAGRLRSWRAVDELRELRDAASRHPAINETIELSDRITETIRERDRG